MNVCVFFKKKNNSVILKCVFIGIFTQDTQYYVKLKIYVYVCIYTYIKN